MKAKHFRKLRQEAQYYFVETSFGLFGDFSFKFSEYAKQVLARNPREAARRYFRRYRREYFDRSETTEQWGKVRIMPVNKPYDRFIKYF